jgi:hypothetical protein
LRTHIKLTNLSIALTILLSGTMLAGTLAEGAYSTGFQSNNIAITVPEKSGFSCNGILHTEGNSKLNQIWYCVRGPGEELATYPVNVVNGYFQLDIKLRFGPGKYTIWVGDNPQRFDGTLRFQIENTSPADERYTASSPYVDSYNPAIKELTSTLVKPQMSELDKLQTIYDWITNNISYDYQAYNTNQNQLVTASTTLKNKKGNCRNYSFLMAALARSAGLQTRVIYGQRYSPSKKQWYPHAWNEVYADGRWIKLDATYDAGYIMNDNFVTSPSREHFDLSEKTYNTYYRNPTPTTH